MTAPSTAAEALIHALKDPGLSTDQRLALVAALQAATGSPAAATRVAAVRPSLIHI